MTHLVNRLIHYLTNLPPGGFLFLFAISAGSLLFWEILRLVTAPIPHRWRWKRRIVPVAISTTALLVVLMGLRFAHFARLI